MDEITWLLAANVAVWLGLGAYVAFLGCKQRVLSNRLQQMEMLKHD
jgi:CcmD family protein